MNSVATNFVLSFRLSPLHSLVSSFSTTSRLATISTGLSDSPAAVTENIDQNDIFHRVDLRVGTILQVDLHTEAEHLYIEKVDIGEPEARTIVSGLAKHIPREELQSKRVVVVANMKASKFRGVLSQGMLLAASSKDQSVVDLLTVPDGSVNGERISIGQLTERAPDSVLKPKQKIFEQVAQHLLTNAEGVATYKGLALTTRAGTVASQKVKHGLIS